MPEVVKKILALDVGSQNVGVAVGDFERVQAGFMPQSLQAFAMPQSKHAFCQHVFSLVRQYRIDTLVLGYPLSSAMAQNMAQNMGQNSRISDDFCSPNVSDDFHSPTSFPASQNIQTPQPPQTSQPPQPPQPPQTSQTSQPPRKFSQSTSQNFSSNHSQQQNWRKKIKALKRRLEIFVATQQQKENNLFPFRVLLQPEHLTTYSAQQSPFFEQMTAGHRESSRPNSRSTSRPKPTKNLSKTKNIDSFAACEILLSSVDALIRQG